MLLYVQIQENVIGARSQPTDTMGLHPNIRHGYQVGIRTNGLPIQPIGRSIIHIGYKGIDAFGLVHAHAGIGIQLSLGVPCTRRDETITNHGKVEGSQIIGIYHGATGYRCLG